MKKQIPCKLDKCDKQEFLSMFDAGICDVNDQVASTVTARYYKGIGAHHDNMVIEIEADEQKEKQILDTILLKDEAKTAGGQHCCKSGSPTEGLQGLEHLRNGCRSRVVCLGNASLLDPTSQSNKIYSVDGSMTTLIAGTHGYANGYIMEEI